ncbi:MAG: hypothetical protein O2877_02180 [bacterium]|nr:hypothetical protein [bacterium]
MKEKDTWHKSKTFWKWWVLHAVVMAVVVFLVSEPIFEKTRLNASGSVPYMVSVLSVMSILIFVWMTQFLAFSLMPRHTRGWWIGIGLASYFSGLGVAIAGGVQFASKFKSATLKVLMSFLMGLFLFVLIGIILQLYAVFFLDPLMRIFL